MHIFRRNPLLVFILILAATLGADKTGALPGESNSGKSTKAQGCGNEDSGLKLPPGFCATIFADDIGHARHMVIAPNGVLYVNTWSGRYYGNQAPHAGGFLVALKDSTGAGKADVIERFGESTQTGGAGGLGIGFYNGYLYAEINDRIVRYSLPSGAVVPKGSPETVVSGLPLGGDHPMHPFAIDSKGLLYIDVATATNACQSQNRRAGSVGYDPCTELVTRGGVWRYDANKTNQVFSPGDRFATGIRNAEGFGIDSSGRIFVTQHGRDQLRLNWPDLYKPEEEALQPAEELLLLKSGGDYGWPECYYDGIAQKLVLAPEYGGDGGKKVGVCADKIAPVAAFPAHWAPNGMALYDKKQFPARYQNGVFIAFHGSWDRAPYAQGGYNVVFQALKGDHASGGCEIFADGFAGGVKTPAGAIHRPSGVAVGPDGVLYVSDDVRGRIYRIVYSGGGENDNAVTPCPSASAPVGAPVAAAARPPEGTHANAGAAANSAAAVPAGATAAMVALGDRIYHGQVAEGTCSGCHGENGKGSPLGPDLTGDKWLWSDGSFEGIAKTIASGVTHPKQYRSPMPPMGGAQLTNDQVMALAAYVWSLGHSAAPAKSSSALPAELIIPGEKIFPESLTSSADGRVIVGSISTRTIFVVKPGQQTGEAWIPPDREAGLGVFGVFADNKSNTLWACLAPIPGSRPPAQASSTLAGYDLQTGAAKGRFPLPAGGAFCNDIAVGGDGSIYVTDSRNMEVDRLQSGGSQLQTWAGQGGFGPANGFLDGISVIGNRVFVNTLNTGKIYAVPVQADGAAGAISEVKLDRAIERPDGMRSFGDSLLIVESGGPGRLSRAEINGNSGQLTTIKEGFPGGPVSVTAVGATGYVLEGQLRLLFAQTDPPATPKPFHATAVDLGHP